MKHLLSGDSLAMVKLLAGERTLCAFDFDGTLAPIVANPDLAAMRPHTRELLTDVASLYPCIILSGRARSDVLVRLKGVPMARIIGGHGADTGEEDKPHQLVQEWKTILEAALGSIQELRIEDKGYCLAVHYRQSQKKAAVRRSILAATGTLQQACVFGGKMVVNVVPAGAPNKGDALASERDRLGCDWILFVGDEESDEDAFALDGNVVPVRVGRSSRSCARYYLRTQAEIDDLLTLLAQLRADNVNGHARLARGA